MAGYLVVGSTGINHNVPIDGNVIILTVISNQTVASIKATQSSSSSTLVNSTLSSSSLSTSLPTSNVDRLLNPTSMIPLTILIILGSYLCT